jgi:CHASE2 domain-containing sensor protein
VQGIFTTAGTFTLVAVTGVIAGTRSRTEMARLVGVLVGLVAGAVVGGLLFRYARIYAPAVPLVTTILVILVGRTTEGRSPRGANNVVVQHD